MAFVGQMLKSGEWVRMGRECSSRAEAEGEVAHHLSVGTACDGRDDSGALLPNNATRVVEVLPLDDDGVMSDAERRDEHERDERYLARGR